MSEVQDEGARRDELAEALRGHRAEIVEADEWRPLADHVLALEHAAEQRGERAGLEKAAGEANRFAGGLSLHYPEEAKSVRMAADAIRALPPLAGGSTREGGCRADLDNIYFRSAWEANYARYLNWLKLRGEVKGWKYEARTFVFRAIKRGTRAYTPDFLVTYKDRPREWHEVKGWLDQPSRTRLARMARYYPAEKIVLIDAAWFRSLNRSGLDGLIPGWEYVESLTRTVAGEPIDDVIKHVKDRRAKRTRPKGPLARKRREARA